MHSFPNLEPVRCSLSGSNHCFLTCIQISQEAGKVVWYSHLFKNFPQFVVIHTVKGFGVVNKAEVDAFLEFFCFFYDPVDVGNLISGSSAFSKSSLNIWRFMVHMLLVPSLENFEHDFEWEMSATAVFWTFFGIAFLWIRGGFLFIFSWIFLDKNFKASWFYRRIIYFMKFALENNWLPL